MYFECSIPTEERLAEGDAGCCAAMALPPPFLATGRVLWVSLIGALLLAPLCQAAIGRCNGARGRGSSRTKTEAISR